MTDNLKKTTQLGTKEALAKEVSDKVKLIKSNSGSKDAVKGYLSEILVALAAPQETITEIRQATVQTREDANKLESKLSNKLATKTYNVRTPYVNLEINDIQIHESPYNGQLLYGETQDGFPEYNSSFKSLNITAPMGGEVGTIQGSVELFTKDPVNFLQAIFYPQGDTTDASYGGFPIATVKFGWTCATGEDLDTNDGVVQLISNPIKLMVHNFSFTDMSSLGVTIKLDLADTGSVLTKNSAGGGLGIEADYPQQQLRILLEKFLKVRLFTLDDFYYFDESQAKSADPSKITGTNTSKTTFVNAVNKPLRLNSELLFYAIELLVSIIKERFTFYSNKDFAEKVKKGSQINTDYSSAQAELKLLEESKSTSKDPSKTDPKVEKRMKELTDKIKASQEELVYGCNLTWVPTIPAGWKTSSGYAGEPGEEGAYVLMPDPTTLIDVNSDLLPVNYGPGASSYPYLFASAQNIVNYQENPSATWGDILGINVSYNSLMAQMAGDTSEVQSYSSDTERLSSFSGKLKNTPQEITSTGRTIKSWNRPVGPEGPASVQAAKEQAKIRVKWTPKNKAMRFKGSVAGRNSNVADDPETSSKAFGGDAAKLAAKDRAASNMEKYSSSNAMLRLKRKVSSFLSFPHDISISVLGDPTLLHQSVGQFELVAYYPIQNEGGNNVDHMFNHFLSGMYLVKQVSHKITANSFTTELQAVSLTISDSLSGVTTEGDKDTHAIGLVSAIDAAASTSGRDREFSDLTRVSAESLPEQATNPDHATFNKILEMYKTRK